MTTMHPAEKAALDLEWSDRQRGVGSRKLQIIPADGWLAAYKDEDSGEVSKLPLSCWALVDTSYYLDTDPNDRVNFQSVEGVLVADGGFAKDRPGFLGYASTPYATVEAPL